MKILVGTAALASLLLVSAGCQKEEAKEPVAFREAPPVDRAGGAGEAEEATEDAPIVFQAVEKRACDFLTEAEASELVGVTLAYRRQNRTECKLESKDLAPVTVTMNLLPGGANELSIYKDAKGAERVSGLGNDAVWALSTMVAEKGGRSASVAVHTAREGVDRKKVAHAVLEKVLSRF